MRVTDRTCIEIVAGQLGAQGASGVAVAEGFKASLQRYRRGGDVDRDEPREKSRSRAPVRAGSRGERPRGEDSTKSDSARPAVPDALGERVPLKAPGQIKPEPVDTGEMQGARRFRRGGAGLGATVGGDASANTAPCIEVTHSRTGLRFLLSRDHDVWLLSIDSADAPQHTEMASIVALLNREFAARGLGAIDVILT